MLKTGLCVLTLCILCAVGVLPCQATLIDFNINQDGSDNNTLQLQRPSQVDEPYELFPIESGPLSGGFGSIEPGWDGEGTDRPEEGAFALLSDEGVALRRESFDAGFSMFTQGLTSILDFDGATHEFAGEPEFKGLLWHQHLTFVADAGTPIGTTLFADFSLTDLDGLHADSEPFTLSFIVVPEPASSLLMMLTAGIPLLRRRRG
jgi:hypothetical protein